MNSVLTNESSTPYERVVQLRTLGQQPYAVTWQAMRQFTTDRDANTRDEIWLLEHPPVYTLGQAGRLEHLLVPGDIEVIRTDRGGQVTYHGPGQLIVYLLLDLRRLGLGIRRVVELLESSVIALLAAHGVTASRRTGAPGVYVEGAKIAALGLRVRSGCCYHGLALNLDMNLTPFAGIHPCGYSDLAVTQLADWVSVERELIEQQLVHLIMQHLELSYHDTPPIDSSIG